jgi:hypothetical protein
MRNPNRIFSNASSQNLRGDLLLLRKARIESINKNVSVDQCRHDCRDFPGSKPAPYPPCALMPDRVRFRVVVASGWPDRITEVGTKNRLVSLYAS